MNVNEAKSAKVRRLAMRRVTFDNDKPQEPPTKRCRITIPRFITSQVKDELRPVLYAWAKLASQKDGDCTETEVMNEVKCFQRQRPVRPNRERDQYIRRIKALEQALKEAKSEQDCTDVATRNNPPRQDEQDDIQDEEEDFLYPKVE